MFCPQLVPSWYILFEKTTTRILRETTAARANIRCKVLVQCSLPVNKCRLDTWDKEARTHQHLLNVRVCRSHLLSGASHARTQHPHAIEVSLRINLLSGLNLGVTLISPWPLLTSRHGVNYLSCRCAMCKKIRRHVWFCGYSRTVPGGQAVGMIWAFIAIGRGGRSHQVLNKQHRVPTLHQRCEYEWNP